MPLTMRDTDTPEQIARHGYHNCDDNCRDLTCICQCHHGSQLHVFIRAIVAAPADEALRLAFADYLEERGEYYACLRVRETARIRPESLSNGRQGWMLYKHQQTNAMMCPRWLFHATAGAEHEVPRVWPTEQEGMRAIIEAILKGGPEWQPSSSGPLQENGRTGVDATPDA